MMTYDLIKFFHIAVDCLWIAGLIFESILLIAPKPLFKSIRVWERWLTNLTMLLVLATGFYLAMAGGWYRDHWLMIKVLLVFVLTGYHGFLAMQLKRMTNEPASKPLLPPAVGIVFVLVMMLVIMWLACAKPF